MTLKLCPDGTPGNTPDERTEAALAAAHELTCLGEILEAIGTNEEVGGALVSWLGERVGTATAVVHAFILGVRTPAKVRN
jgi:hypothetical protein